jgi:protease-4
VSAAPQPAAPVQGPQPARARGCLLPFAVFVLLASVALNVVFLLGYTGAISDPLSDDPDGIEEHFYLGDAKAKDKIAVVRVSGVISDAGIAFPITQLRTAAADPKVKAVVLRINSPGGTVSASEELYQCVVNLRDNTGRRFPGSGAKPVSVSMGALCASGGYYIAAAGNPIVAEKTTITGSIGVFAALPNVSEWAKTHGVKLELVKAGGIKASGSLFHSLSPDERETWQNVVDNAYDEFLNVIARGRPGLTPEALRSEVVVDRQIPKRDDKGNPVLENGKPVEVRYTRVRADGGTYTPTGALQFKLIDGIDDLPGAVRAAASRHGLSNFRAVVYEKPTSLIERATGLNIEQRGALDFSRLPDSLSPRLWYLAPSADAGLLTPAP